MKRYATTSSITKILLNVSHRDWEHLYLYASYGIQEDVFGRKVLFTNHGTYYNKEDAITMIKAFYE